MQFSNKSGQVIIGNITNSTVNNVRSPANAEIDQLIALVEKTAGSDRAELVSLLREVRSYLVDKTTDHATAASSFETFLGRAAKYAKSAKEIWDLAGSIGAALN